jgi:hypothetical protein
MLIYFLGIKLDFMGRLCAGFFDGTVHEVKTEFTDADISVAVGLRDTMEHCEPWSNHISVDGLQQLDRALRSQNVEKARNIIDLSKTDSHAPWCIEILKTAVVVVCTKCPRILKEAMPQNFY